MATVEKVEYNKGSGSTISTGRTECNLTPLSAADFSAELRQLMADLAGRAGAANPQQLSLQLAMLIAGATVSEQARRQSGAMRTAALAAEVLINDSLEQAVTAV